MTNLFRSKQLPQILMPSDYSKLWNNILDKLQSNSSFLVKIKLLGFILFNGFQKKTQKTPKEEMDLALKLKDDYFNSKG